MATLITQAEYARRRQVSREAVRLAIKDGRITGIPSGGRVMVDPEVADIQWARNTDPTQQQRGAPEQFAITQQRAEEASGHAATPGVASSAPVPPPADDDEPPALVREKAETERLRQGLLELDLAQRRGELVRVSDVERAHAAKLVAARELFESLPDRLASQLAAMTDATAIHLLLSDEIRLAMSRLVGEAPAGVN